MAPEPGTGHAGRRHRDGCAGQRDFCRVGAAGGNGAWDFPGVCGFHYCGAGGRCGGNGDRILCRTQRPIGSQCGRGAGKRGADRAVRRASAGSCQLFDRSDADGSAILEGRSRNDAGLDPDRIACDQQRPLGLVHRDPCGGRVPDFCLDALPPASPGPLTAALGRKEIAADTDSMLRQLLAGGAVSVINIAIHALIMVIVVRVAQARGARSRSHSSLLLMAVMIPTVLVLMLTHALEVAVWALAYSMLDAAGPNAD